jgi:hypothetical protein
MLSAAILFLIAKVTTESKNKKFWISLCGIFIFLAVDEATEIHEKLVFENHLPDFLFYSWVIPYGILLAGLAIYIYKFLFSLPKATYIKFTIAGMIYVSGAIGGDFMEGHLEVSNGSELAFYISVLLEESMEMIGVVLFIRALLQYFTSYCPAGILLAGKRKTTSKKYSILYPES